MTAFKPNLQILSESQVQLWPELASAPPHFVLYGGTALALRYGHRPSVDFDFFSSQSFRPDDIVAAMPFLREGERLQSKANTLTISVNRGSPVRLSFFGGLSLGRVGEPTQAEDNRVLVASPLDLSATKVAVVQQRAEKRDYLDIARLIEAGIRLEDALGAAAALYGDNFNPAITLKALTYFADGDLPALPKDIQQFLASRAVNVTDIPVIPRISDTIAPV